MSSNEWIEFVPAPRGARMKTKRWFVRSKDNGGDLGWISWYGPWRRYAFQPAAFTRDGKATGVVFEQDCLRRIADFIEEQTREHKEGR